MAAELKGTRYALWKNPENLTARQRSKLADVETLNRPLYRAYLLKNSCGRSTGSRRGRQSPCLAMALGRGAVASPS